MDLRDPPYRWPRPIRVSHSAGTGFGGYRRSAYSSYLPFENEAEIERVLEEFKKPEEPVPEKQEQQEITTETPAQDLESSKELLSKTESEPETKKRKTLL